MKLKLVCSTLLSAILLSAPLAAAQGDLSTPPSDAIPKPHKPSKLQRLKKGKKPAAKAEVWTCPMHPEVHSDKPGACPKCHMDLVKKP